MQFDEKFKKIPWIYEVPDVFENGIVVSKRLDSVSEESQKMLIYSVMQSLMKNFNSSDSYMGKSSCEQIRNSEFESQLLVWLSGLCNVSIAQIVGALVDILEMKTEYQKYPPKSVMEFHAVCKSPRPAYHDVPPAPSNAKQIGWDKEYARARTEKIATKCLKEIFAKFGKDYEKVRQEKIENGVYGKQFKKWKVSKIR